MKIRRFCTAQRFSTAISREKFDTSKHMKNSWKYSGFTAWMFSIAISREKLETIREFLQWVIMDGWTNRCHWKFVFYIFYWRIHRVFVMSTHCWKSLHNIWRSIGHFLLNFGFHFGSSDTFWSDEFLHKIQSTRRRRIWIGPRRRRMAWHQVIIDLLLHCLRSFEISIFLIFMHFANVC